MTTPTHMRVLFKWAERERFGCPDQIPMHFLEAHSEQVRRNHGQTLEQLNARGGLHPSEIVALLNDRKWKAVPFEEAVIEMLAIMNEATERVTNMRDACRIAWTRADGRCPIHDANGNITGWISYPRTEIECECNAVDSADEPDPIDVSWSYELEAALALGGLPLHSVHRYEITSVLLHDRNRRRVGT